MMLVCEELPGKFRRVNTFGQTVVTMNESTEQLNASCACQRKYLVNEQVLSTRVRGDEAEALCGVEPDKQNRCQG
jgi:hypothetical protein